MTAKHDLRCTCCGMKSEELVNGVCADCKAGTHQIHCATKEAKPAAAPAPAPEPAKPTEAVVVAAPTAVEKPKSQLDTVKSFLERMKGNMLAVLPKHLTPERMIKVALVACTKQPKLLEASAQSMAAAVMQAAELGLEPGGALGHGYLVPFNNKKKMPDGSEKWVTEVQFIPGYRGLIELARRSGEIAQIGAWPVFKGEVFEYSISDKGQRLNHIPKFDGPRNAEDLTHVYMIARLKGEDLPQIEVMTRADVEAVRARSKAKDFGPWKTDYVEMARKTVVRRGIKYLPVSSEKVSTVIDLDNRSYEEATLEVLGDDDDMPKRLSVTETEGEQAAS